MPLAAAWLAWVFSPSGILASAEHEHVVRLAEIEAVRADVPAPN
jgi:hypothetical protein